MFLKFLSRFANNFTVLHRRTYYSSRITSLFVNNFDLYAERLKSFDKSHTQIEIACLLDEFKQLTSSLKDVENEIGNEAQSDKELAGLMKEEKVELEEKQNDLLTKILNEIYSYEVSRDEERIPDSSSILFEISPGVGGKEAMLFANEMYVMYSNYFDYKRWDMQDVEVDEQGGYMRHFHAKVEGFNVWGHMKFEAGVHRVQRIPETESRGRIHTSTVSLACIPVIVDAGVEINGEQEK